MKSRIGGLQLIGYRVYCWMLLLVVLPMQQSPMLYADSKQNAPEIESEAAILIESETGTVLFAKNEEQRMYPASITKLVTAIVALESAPLDDIVTVSKTARYEDGTRIYLAEGEQKPMSDLLYGLMLNSGNDAATAIAEHIDGSKEQFANRMTEFVRTKIGVLNTLFANPSGLPDPDHYTTAADMAKIAQYAMSNPTFRSIVSTKTMPWKGAEWDSELVNHNKLLWSYKGATGIKNGFTQAAGFTLVASAERNGMELIGVVLKASNAERQYGDMKQLLDYGFSRFNKQELFTAGETFTQNGEHTKQFVASRSIQAVIPIDEQPIVNVDGQGKVEVSSSIGLLTAGKLDEIVSQDEQDLIIEPNLESANLQEHTPALPNRTYWPVWAAWLFLNLFLVLIAVLRIKIKGSP